MTDEEVLINAGEDENFGFGPAKYAVGPSLLGYSLYSMRNQTPGGIRRTVADFASNRLEGFYKPGAWKAPRYGWELFKTGGRIGYSAYANLANSGFYNETGVSPVVMRDLEGIKNARDLSREKYLSYKKGYTDLSFKNDVKFAEKKLYFKLTSDKANQLIFGGKVSPIIDKIVGDNVKLTNVNRFIQAADGSTEIADYVLRGHESIKGRGQTVGDTKGLQFIKYKPGRFGDVLRATQFDRNFYQTILNLKNHGTVGTVESIILNGGYKPKRLSNGKYIFRLSPSIKPDWDWGGFNSVAIWDPNDKEKIRIIASDVPDVDIKGRPVPGSGGKYPAIKYVDSKEISISEGSLKKRGINIAANDEIINRKDPNWWQRVRGWTKDRYYRFFGYPDSKTKRHKIDRVKRVEELDKKTLFSKEQQNEIEKLKKERNKFRVSNLKKISRLGRNLAGPAGIALMAYQLLSGDD